MGCCFKYIIYLQNMHTLTIQLFKPSIHFIPRSQLYPNIQVRVSQNGSIHRKRKTDFLYGHYSFSLRQYNKYMRNNIEGYFQLRQRRRARVRKYRFMCEVTCVDSPLTKDRTTAVNIAGNIWHGTSFSLGQSFISYCLEGGTLP